ncbi:MAG: transglutaminase family protein [Acetobacteraceae bacterium]|nr:transglutaminase family protein [Acetobacteraceae bacterium]
MPMSVALHHRTNYVYGRSVAIGPQVVRLHPAPHARATIRSYNLAVVPEPEAVHWLRDPSGNLLARLLFAQPAEALALTVTLHAELAEVNPFEFVLEPEAGLWPFAYPALLRRELAAFLGAAAIEPWLLELLDGFPLGGQATVDLLVGLNRHLCGKITYIQRLEPGVLGPAQTIQGGTGSCRDVAWLLVCVARALGFAARFVSGYLIQLVDAAGPTPGLETDRADLHAWAEVYLPGAGWIGFDATSGLMTGSGHIPLAATADPASAAPVSGTVGTSAEADFAVEMRVTRLS